MEGEDQDGLSIGFYTTRKSGLAEKKKKNKFPGIAKKKKITKSKESTDKDFKVPILIFSIFTFKKIYTYNSL